MLLCYFAIGAGHSVQSEWEVMKLIWRWESLIQNRWQLFCQLRLLYVQYSIYGNVLPFYVKREKKEEKTRYKLTCVHVLDTHRGIYVIKAFEDISLCQRRCARGGRDRRSSMFHVLFSLFLSGFAFCLAACSPSPALPPAFILLSVSAPTGQPGCIHQALPFCLFVYGGCTRWSGAAVTLSFDKWQP